MISQSKQRERNKSQVGNMLNEADIGSGEKTSGELETQNQIAQIPQRGTGPSDKKSPERPKEKTRTGKDGEEGLLQGTEPFPPKGN